MTLETDLSLQQPRDLRAEEAADVLASDFDDEPKAREARLAATRLGRRHSVEMTDAAIVTKTPTGRTKIIQCLTNR